MLIFRYQDHASSYGLLELVLGEVVAVSEEDLSHSLFNLTQVEVVQPPEGAPVAIGHEHVGVGLYSELLGEFLLGALHGVEEAYWFFQVVIW